MDLLKRESHKGFNRPEENFSKFFNQLMYNFWPAPWDEDSHVMTSEWIPSVDFREEKDRFVINADIPGVDPKDIEVSMDNGMISLKGERSAMEKTDTEGYHRLECRHGTFHRRFSLPDSADPEKIEAKDKHGVLTITIGKRQNAKPKMIAIKS